MLRSYVILVRGCLTLGYERVLGHERVGVIAIGSRLTLAG
jgi:hypothetical protein